MPLPCLLVWKRPDADTDAAPVTDPGLHELVLHAPFVALEGKQFDQQSFAVLDTPGPNEAKVRVQTGSPDPCCHCLF